jgi:hypothetical protein
MRMSPPALAMVCCCIVAVVSCAHGVSPAGLALAERREVSECLSSAGGVVASSPECQDFFWNGLSRAASEFACSNDEDCRVVHIRDAPDYWGWFAVPSKWEGYDAFLEGVTLRCGMSTPYGSLGKWPKPKCRSGMCVVEGAASVAPPEGARCSTAR